MLLSASKTKFIYKLDFFQTLEKVLYCLSGKTVPLSAIVPIKKSGAAASIGFSLVISVLLACKPCPKLTRTISCYQSTIKQI